MTLEYKETMRLMEQAEEIHSSVEVNQAVDQVAAQITEEYQHKQPILLCLMNGGLYFMGMLIQRLSFPLEQDFFQVSRYRGNKKGHSTLEWKAYPQTEVKGRHIIIVDDILDEGPTLSAIIQYLKTQEVASVKSAVLVDKVHDRREPEGFCADFTGLKVKDLFLVGCGMDFQGYFRNLPGVYALKGD